MKNQQTVNSTSISHLDDPFEIIKNFRKKAETIEKPKRKASTCVRSESKKENVQKMRKYTADIQIQNELRASHQNEEETIKQCEMKDEDHQSFNLWNNDSLENAIPLGHSEDNDILYNMNSQSLKSTYSKLERTLFGLNMEESCIHEE